MKPYVQDVDFTLYVGDVRDVLSELPDESVHCVVTSPPYWGLRDYGTGSWEGGDPDCDHSTPRSRGDDIREGDKQGTSAGSRPNTQTECKCGARRVDQQLGLEPTPELYVENMVQVFREVRRVLRRDGTCWLNIGDSYNAHPGTRGSERREKETLNVLDSFQGYEKGHGLGRTKTLKPKDLCGIPWRLAFALQADGWYLRSEIIWAKPNPMPESVTDRPTKSHEQVFLLTRSPRYFYDADAVREPAEWARWGDQTNGKHEGSESAAGWIGSKSKAELRSGRVGRYKDRAMYGKGDGTTPRKVLDEAQLGRNLRSVWEIPTQPFPEAHFATYPQALVERCIKAGTKPGDLVLDPFLGSGTTALVARRLGRRSIGIELNEQYAEMAARRLSQLSLLAEEVA